jgi:hypothetical protein
LARLSRTQADLRAATSCDRLALGDSSI